MEPWQGFPFSHVDFLVASFFPAADKTAQCISGNANFFYSSN